MGKKITPAIAKALAEQVRISLVAISKNHTPVITEKVKKDPAYKKMVKVHDKLEKLEGERKSLQTSLSKKYSSDSHEVNFMTSYSPTGHYTYIREKTSTSIFTVENIKNQILLESFFENDKETADEIVKKMIAHFEQKLKTL